VLAKRSLLALFVGLAPGRSNRRLSVGNRCRKQGERAAARLYMGADGFYVRLQVQARTHLELRRAIAYEGWKRLTSEREGCRLRGNGSIVMSGSDYPSGKEPV
jgi:hypothetical protein